MHYLLCKCATTFSKYLCWIVHIFFLLFRSHSIESGDMNVTQADIMEYGCFCLRLDNSWIYHIWYMLVKIISTKHETGYSYNLDLVRKKQYAYKDKDTYTCMWTVRYGVDELIRRGGLLATYPVKSMDTDKNALVECGQSEYDVIACRTWAYNGNIPKPVMSSTGACKTIYTIISLSSFYQLSLASQQQVSNNSMPEGICI